MLLSLAQCGSRSRDNIGHLCIWEMIWILRGYMYDHTLLMDHFGDIYCSGKIADFLTLSPFEVYLRF